MQLVALFSHAQGCANGLLHGVTKNDVAEHNTLREAQLHDDMKSYGSETEAICPFCSEAAGHIHTTRENHPMNQEVFAGQWKHIRGELQAWWGKLAESDFDKIRGQKDQLVGIVQEKYGYAREQAQQEVERRLQEYGDTMSGPNSRGRRDTAAAVAGGPANASNKGPIATAATAVAGGVASAQDTIATAATAVADGWESAQGALSTAATAVAGGVESASAYLQEQPFDEMATDLTALIRTYPVPSFVVGVGLGYLLARLTSR